MLQKSLLKNKIDYTVSWQIFEKFADKQTGLYREGAAYVYQYYLEEQK